MAEGDENDKAIGRTNDPRRRTRNKAPVAKQNRSWLAVVILAALTSRRSARGACSRSASAASSASWASDYSRSARASITAAHTAARSPDLNRPSQKEVNYTHSPAREPASPQKTRASNRGVLKGARLRRALEQALLCLGWVAFGHRRPVGQIGRHHRPYPLIRLLHLRRPS